ncbi:MAG: MMPL family transporter, partial [Deltaproteobacteria bacterium]|nr:MMPL family transporter [Deltaproteobacteria bacterium]
EANNFLDKVAMMSALKKIAAPEQDRIRVCFGGTPHIDEIFYLYSKKDARVIMPLAVVLVMVGLFFIFRHVATTVIPLVIILLSTLWLFGIMGFLGIRLNVITVNVCVIVLTISVADSIHILSDYYQWLIRGDSREAAIKKSFVDLFTPCVFNAATTIAGMLSLLVSSLRPVREFGLFSALGVGLALILSMTLIPVILSFASPPHRLFIERFKSGLMHRALSFLASPTLKRSVWILSVSAVLFAVSLFYLSKLDVGANVLNYFKKDDPVRLETHAIEDQLSGVGSVEFVITTRQDGLKDVRVLNKIEQFQKWLKTLGGVAHIVSITEELKDMNRVFGREGENTSVLPASTDRIAQYFFVLESEDDFESVVQDNYTVTRISMRVRLSDARELARQVPLIEEKLETELGDAVIQSSMTGFVKLMHNMETYLLASQKNSISVTLVSVVIMLSLFFKSLRLGLLSLIPNIIPIVLGLAFMAVRGISVDPGTVMIASICLGIVVDDTVHFLSRLKKLKKQHVSLESAIGQAMHEMGRPIMITSLVLALGFAVLVFASFNPNVYFGLISALVILAALVAELVVMPAVLVVFKPRI